MRRRIAQGTLLLLFATAAGADLPADPVQQWRWPMVATFDGPFPTTPTLVVQLTDDDGDGSITTADVPDIVVMHWLLGGIDTASMSAFDGATGAEHWTVSSPAFMANSAGALLAAADLDGDAVVELIVTDRTQFHVFAADGTHAWSRPWPRPFVLADKIGLGIGVADLNQDGVPEVYSQDMVVSVDGSMTWVGGAGPARDWTDGYSHVVDIDPTSPGLELIDGGTIYSATGAVLHRDLSLPRGHLAIGDVDGDGDPEIAMAFAEFQVVLLDHQLNQIGPSHDTLWDHHGSTAADIDGDGRAEILVPTPLRLMALEWDGTGLALKWTTPTRDGSCCARVTAYDFDGDGASEIVYRDMFEWFVFCGDDGSPLFREASTSYTGAERFAVADVDGDDVAEIVVTAAQGGDWNADVLVYEVAGAVTPRAIWNQDSYHGTNVNDDGTVPRVETPPWSTHGAWLTQVPAVPNRPLDPFDTGQVVDLDACTTGLLVDWDALDVAQPGQPVTYDVYRSAPGGDCADAIVNPPIATGLVDTEWLDVSPAPGVMHSYVVNAVAGSGVCPWRDLCVSGVDNNVGPPPDGVYLTLRARHDGHRVTMTWDAARPLLPDESFYLLKAVDTPVAFSHVNPPGDMSRSHSETDTAFQLQFFDLRVESCGQLSADEYPPTI